jgi:Dullard-like phosphatase family protein
LVCQDGDPFTISSARSDRSGSYPSAQPLVSQSISSEELTPNSTPRGVTSPSQLSIITSIDDDSSDTMSGLRGWLPPLGHRPHPPSSSTPSSTSSFSRASTATWTLQSTTNSLVSSSDDRFADLVVDNPINFPLQKQNAQQAAMTITQDFGIEADLLILNKVKSCQVNRSPLVPGQYRHLLPAITDLASKRITLVLDLDETLIHASSRFRPEVKHELVIPVKDDNKATVGVAYVAFRPHVHRFLREVSQLFEVVAFTSSLPEYADPILDALDPSKKLISHRLYRDHCVEVKGKKVKDLSLLGRPLHRVAIIDNSPAAYLFQPRNAIPIRSWFHDPHDRDLLKLLKLLEHLSTAKKVYPVLDQYNAHLISKLRSS